MNMPYRLLTLIFAAASAQPALLSAQTGTMRGGVRGSVDIRAIAPDPTQARVHGADEFRALDVERRRQAIMNLAAAPLVPGGEKIDGLLLAALADEDPLVVRSALGMLQRYATTANLARLTGKPVATSPFESPATTSALIALTSHSNPGVRGMAFATLGTHLHASDAVLSVLTLGARSEADASVRGRIVTALGSFAGNGPSVPMEILLASLDDAAAEIRFSAVMGLRRARSESVLRQLLSHVLTEQDVRVRQAILGAVQDYNGQLKAYRSALGSWYAAESDERIRAGLEALLSGTA
jgi:DNA-binding phage protein